MSTSKAKRATKGEDRTAMYAVMRKMAKQGKRIVIGSVDPLEIGALYGGSGFVVKRRATREDYIIAAAPFGPPEGAIPSVPFYWELELAPDADPS